MKCKSTKQLPAPATIGRRMWTSKNFEFFSPKENTECCSSLEAPFEQLNVPVLVLPLDPASVQAMRQLIVNTIWPYCAGDIHEKQALALADVVLARLNITVTAPAGWKKEKK